MVKLNQEVSTPIAITIIVVLAVLLIGGIFTYQHYYLTPEEESRDVWVPQKPSEAENFSNLNKDDLLQKLFPNLTFKNGVAVLPDNIIYPGAKLYLKDSVEDYFISNQEKNLLLIVKLDGIPHVNGLYHAYLGLFDKNGNLLTFSSSFPEPNFDNPYGDDFYNFHLDKAQFGGDRGEFSFYDCNGVKYILFVSHGCITGTCCSGKAELFKVDNGLFRNVQKIEEQISLSINLLDDKLIIKKVPAIMGKKGCPETDYKELKWNKNNCLFE